MISAGRIMIAKGMNTLVASTPISNSTRRYMTAVASAIPAGPAPPSSSLPGRCERGAGDGKARLSEASNEAERERRERRHRRRRVGRPVEAWAVRIADGQHGRAPRDQRTGGERLAETAGKPGKARDQPQQRERAH